MAFPITVEATWMDNSSVSYTAGELRRADAAGFAGAGTPLGVGGGVVRHSDTSLAVTVDASDVVTIQPGAVVIPGNAVAGSGCYRSALATAQTGSLTARNATNPRIDLIVFRALDTDVVGAHAAYTGRIDVITGTPAGSPSAPALPTMAVELGRVTVPALGGPSASVDSSRRTYATAIGGTIIVPSAASLPTSAPTRTRARAIDTGAEYEWNGSSWVDAFTPPAWATISPTMAAGWSLGSARQRVVNGLAEVRIIATRTGTTITGTSDGNITNTTLVSSGIPNAPSEDVYGRFVNNATSGSWRVESGGSATLTDLYPTSTIPNGGAMTFRIVYFLG